MKFVSTDHFYSPLFTLSEIETLRQVKLNLTIQKEMIMTKLVSALLAAAFLTTGVAYAADAKKEAPASAVKKEAAASKAKKAEKKVVKKAAAKKEKKAEKAASK